MPAFVLVLALHSLLACKIGNQALAGERVDLIICIAGYKYFSSHPTAASDAKAIGAALKRVGFAVTEVSDPTHRELQKS